jgi:DNA (cytosine-5)-methyltransferase 1
VADDHPAHIDLFSGIGGFALAARRTGFRTVVFCERDEWCQRVLRKHWPDVPCVSDIHNFDGSAYTGAFILTGGFPCQPWSLAGKRGGDSDDRSLGPEMLRIVAEARPRWVLGENTPGFDTAPLGLDAMLDVLEDLGYSSGAVILPACAINAGQIRRRVWILACSECVERKTWAGPSIAVDQTSSDQPRGRAWWMPKPAVERKPDGLPRELDRLRALGNAIVPQVAEEIMRMIAKIEEEHAGNGGRRGD